MSVTLSEILPRLASATPEQLAAIGRVLDGKPSVSEPPPLKIKDAATRLGYSRYAVHRFIGLGALEVIYTPSGGRRVKASSVEKLLAGGWSPNG